MQRALVRPAVPPPEARRPRSGRIVSRMASNTTTGTTSPATQVISGTDDATAPRSDRGGRRYRGSRVLVALAPATHGYLLRPLRGRIWTARRRPDTRNFHGLRRGLWLFRACGALEFCLLNDRGAVEGNSRGSHGGECNEPSCDPRYLHPERADRGAVALSPEWEATRRRARHRLRRTLSMGLTMRPLRGRIEVGGGTAGPS